MYQIKLMIANFEARRIASEGNVVIWHIADALTRPGVGPPIAALPTFGAECLVIAAFPTWRKGVAKVGT